jgi:glycosyltransferase involved in cell wall biosynthesis
MDSWTCAQAQPVVVLSDDMAKTLIDRNHDKSPKTVVINNFSLPSEGATSHQLPFPWPTEQFVLLFAGNIGRFQGLDALMDAMQRLRDRHDIRLVMMGDGTEKERLARQADESGVRVSFVGHQPIEVAKGAMARASVGFVSLLPELYRYAYPSKTMTYLEQGCPVLVAVEKESCLARDLVDNGAGVAIPSGDVESLANAISSLANDLERLGSMRARALEFSGREFDIDVVLAKWSSLLQ